MHARVLAGCRRTMPAHAGFTLTVLMRLPAFSAREPKALGPRGPCRQGVALARPDSWRQGRQKMPEKPAPLFKQDSCQEALGKPGDQTRPCCKSMRAGPTAGIASMRSRPAAALAAVVRRTTGFPFSEVFLRALTLPHAGFLPAQADRAPLSQNFSTGY